MGICHRLGRADFSLPHKGEGWGGGTPLPFPSPTRGRVGVGGHHSLFPPPYGGGLGWGDTTPISLPLVGEGWGGGTPPLGSLALTPPTSSLPHEGEEVLSGNSYASGSLVNAMQPWPQGIR